MKKIFNINIAIVALMVTGLFSSCLKDSSREYDLQDSSPVVDFALTAFKGSSLQTATISLAAGQQNVNALITVQSPNPTTVPVVVNVVIDQAAMTTLAPTYTLLPASTYTITGGSMTVTVPPGVGLPAVGSLSPGQPATLPLGYTPSSSPAVPIVGALPAVFSAGQNALTFVVDAAAVKALPTSTAAGAAIIYALPLTITSATGQGVIVDQYHTLIYKIVVGA